MFRTIITLIRFSLYALLVLVGITFAVSNRARVDLTFYPLPYALEVPLFLFGIVLFVLGLLLGWAIGQTAALKAKRGQKQAGKRLAALENELGALRSEQLIRPAALPPR